MICGYARSVEAIGRAVAIVPTASCSMEFLLFAYSNNAQGWAGPPKPGGGTWAELLPVAYGAGLVICIAALIAWFAIMRPGRG